MSPPAAPLGVSAAMQQLQGAGLSDLDRYLLLRRLQK